MRPHEQTKMVTKAGKIDDKYEISYKEGSNGSPSQNSGFSGGLPAGSESSRNLNKRRGSGSPNRKSPGRVRSPKRQSPRNSDRRIASPNRRSPETRRSPKGGSPSKNMNNRQRSPRASPQRDRKLTNGSRNPDNIVYNNQGHRVNPPAQGYPLAQSQNAYPNYAPPPPGYFANTGSQYGAPIYPPHYPHMHPGYSISYHPTHPPHVYTHPQPHPSDSGPNSHLANADLSPKRYVGYPANHAPYPVQYHPPNNYPHPQGNIQNTDEQDRQFNDSGSRRRSPRNKANQQDEKKGNGKTDRGKRSPGRERGKKGNKQKQKAGKEQKGTGAEKYDIDAEEMRLSGSGVAEYLQKNLGAEEGVKGVMDSIDQMGDFSKRNIRFQADVHFQFLNINNKRISMI